MTMIASSTWADNEYKVALAVGDASIFSFLLLAFRASLLLTEALEKEIL